MILGGSEFQLDEDHSGKCHRIWYVEGNGDLKNQLSCQQCGDRGRLARGSRAESGLGGVGGAAESAQHR